MDSFPAFFPLKGRTIVVAGAGEAAEAKARLFDGSPATVARLTPAEALDAGRYAGAVLAFIAGGDLAFLTAAATAARAAGVPVNVVDHPALCDFTTPALVDRGEVVAAVGTSGGAPMLASLLRSDLEARIPEGAGRVAALFRTMNDEVRAALPDLAARRAFLAQALRGPAAEAAMAGDMAAAQAMLREALTTSGGAVVGSVTLVCVGDSADLLSLRAARALAEADAVILDPQCPSAVIGMARRDARRLSGEDAGPDRLVALAAAGDQIVWAVVGEAPVAAVSALEKAGVSVRVLRSALV
jgi:precorrin-2 dehydrogenase/sirohydrochlorin ferrochelatase